MVRLRDINAGVERIEVDQDLSQFMKLPSRDEVLECYRQFYIATGNLLWN